MAVNKLGHSSTTSALNSWFALFLMALFKRHISLFTPFDGPWLEMKLESNKSSPKLPSNLTLKSWHTETHHCGGLELRPFSSILSSDVGAGGTGDATPSPLILADQLPYTNWGNYADHITTCTPEFSNLPRVLLSKGFSRLFLHVRCCMKAEQTDPLYLLSDSELAK